MQVTFISYLSSNHLPSSVESVFTASCSGLGCKDCAYFLHSALENFVLGVVESARSNNHMSCEATVG